MVGERAGNPHQDTYRERNSERGDLAHGRAPRRARVRPTVRSHRSRVYRNARISTMSSARYGCRAHNRSHNGHTVGASSRRRVQLSLARQRILSQAMYEQFACHRVSQGLPSLRMELNT